LEGHVACIGETGNARRILFAKSEGRDHLEDVGADGKMLLEWILGKNVGRLWTGCISSSGLL